MNRQRISLVLLSCGTLLVTSCTPGTGPFLGDGGDTPSGSPVPEELTGKWQSITTYLPANFENIIPLRDFIGSFGIFYYFTVDGQYQFDLRAMASYFDHMCYINDHRQEWGIVQIAGPNFTFHPMHAYESDFDSCGESQYIDPAPTETRTMTLVPEFDATGWPYLHLIFPDGEEVWLERCRDCE